MGDTGVGTGLTRRRLLAGAGGLALATATGCTTTPSVPDGFGGASCVSRGSLAAHRTLAGLPLVYEPSRRRTRFWFEPEFFGLLEDWADELAPALGSAPKTLSTYGSWTDGGDACDSWHHAGRAFDLARVTTTDGAVVSCRYDQWGAQTGARQQSSQVAYWRLAASLHARFAYVLTYLYNDQHANHIHVDNSRSGSGPSTFQRRSRVQVQAVQAICTYLWDQPVALTGEWDAATRRASEAVLGQIGAPGELDAADSGWPAFLAASEVRDPR